VPDLPDDLFGVTAFFVPRAPRPWQPAVDVLDCGDELRLVVELAGADSDSLDVTYHEFKRELVISGNRPRPDYAGPVKYRQSKIQFGPFRRRLVLPPGLEIESISAEYRHNGLLILRLVRRKPPSPRKIEISTD